jgi:hypothetical protein
MRGFSAVDKSSPGVNLGLNIDGFVKSPSAALRGNPSLLDKRGCPLRLLINTMLSKEGNPQGKDLTG